MKNSIAVFILSLLVCAGSAIAWPWGNVGLNVASPEEQLDVGGNLLVRSNVVIRGSHLQLGEYGQRIYPGIRSWDPEEYRFNKFGLILPNSFSFGPEDGPYYGFGLDGRIGGDVDPPWYTDVGGPEWGNAAEGTNRASIRVTYNPPGFIFNVNGVIWTNTP